MSLNYSAIISNELVEHTAQTLSGEENLSYYIDDTYGWSFLDRYSLNRLIEGSRITTFNVSHDNSKKIFIRNIFSRLDEIIDIDFTEMSHNDGSMLDIYHVNYSSNFKPNVVGMAIPQESNSRSWWDILWKDAESNVNNNINLNTIIHEIGHCLGLAHPYNDPNNKAYNSSDTVMSYNQGPNGWNEWFSVVDLNALISIWGRENDLGIVNFEENSIGYKYTKSLDNNYYIKTDIGLENITEVDTLQFVDKSIDVQKDIINVFNLVKGKNDITGKIYRLYNSALGRFPDFSGLTYWINQNNYGIDSYRKTAQSFILSNEFKILYGEDSTDHVYISSLYSNILNRKADTEGYNYWVNQLEKGYEDRSEILMGFSESLENQAIFSNETSIF